MKAAWTVVETDAYVHGWHVEALCEHLEAVTNFDIRLLLANLPPRHSKSTVISQIWPAWVWTTHPEKKFIFITYNAGLAGRDASKMRQIVESEWYKSYWGERVKLRDDKNTEKEFYNTANGMRFSTAVDGRLTGDGADYTVIDDPHNAAEAYSIAAMKQVELLWTDAIQSRRNDPLRSCKVVACQRIAPNDLSSVILRQKSRNLVHLCLPALYDPERACSTSTGFTDPRSIPNEPLYPQRWPAEALLELRDDGEMSSFAWHAQYQQNPRARGAAVFTRDMWRVWEAWDLPMMEQVIIGLDCASKDTVESDYTACTVWGLFRPPPDPDLIQPKQPSGEMFAMLLGAWKRKLEFPDLKPAVIKTIETWTERCWGSPPDWIFIEDKSAGIGLIQELQRAGIGPIQSYNPGKASKIERGRNIQEVFRDGCIWVPGRKNPASRSRSPVFGEPFAEEVIADFEVFGRIESDDYVDSSVPVIQFYRDRRFLSVSTDKEPDDEEADERASEGRMRASPYG